MYNFLIKIPTCAHSSSWILRFRGWGHTSTVATQKCEAAK